MAIGVLAALCVGEGAVRVFGLAPAAPTELDPFREFHTLSDDPEVGFTLRPGVRGTFQEAEVRVNDRGCRDDATVADPGLRILALGDSITFGASIDQDESWEARLDVALGDGVDVINCGVSGYNLLQAQARYDVALSDLAPDVILLNLFSDDLLPPYRLTQAGPREWLRARSAAFRVAELGLRSLLGGGGRQLPEWAENEEDYRLEAARRASAWVRARGDAGQKVLVVVHPMLIPITQKWQATDSEVRTFAESLGQPTLYFEPLYDELTEGQLQELSIAPAAHDPHPNDDGQELMAVALWRRLHELGWVDVPPKAEAGPR